MHIMIPSESEVERRKVEVIEELEAETTDGFALCVVLCILCCGTELLEEGLISRIQAPIQIRSDVLILEIK